MDDNPHGVRFECVWGEKSEELLKEIVGLWKDAGVTTGNQPPEERAKQALFLARKDEKIIGISTSYAAHIPHMKNHLFMFRAMVHPKHRIPGLLEIITSKSIEHLESVYQETEPYCIGVMALLESKLLQDYRMVHSPSGLTFIGYTPQGIPIRAYFFKGAKF